MASYFVAVQPQADGAHAVHDRGRCPPGRFPGQHGVEYLGEFNEPGQALVVARLRFPAVRGCDCCAPAAAPPAPARCGTPAWPGWEPQPDRTDALRAAVACGGTSMPVATKGAPGPR